MTRIPMRAVYEAVQEANGDRIRVAASEGKEVIGYNFSQFRIDVRYGDLITTESTVKAKWDGAIADGVIQPYGAKPYTGGHLIIDALNDVLGQEKCVCMCVYDAPKAKEGAQ